MPLARMLAKAGGPKPHDQFPAGHGLGPEGESFLPEVGGHVIVVTLENPQREAQHPGEGVELFVGVVADQMSPPLPSPGPDGFVDQDRSHSVTVSEQRTKTAASDIPAGCWPQAAQGVFAKGKFLASSGPLGLGVQKTGCAMMRRHYWA